MQNPIQDILDRLDKIIALEKSSMGYRPDNPVPMELDLLKGMVLQLQQSCTLYPATNGPLVRPNHLAIEGAVVRIEENMANQPEDVDDAVKSVLAEIMEIGYLAGHADAHKAWVDDKVRYRCSAIQEGAQS